MITVSLCMIVKNEENKLSRCLESLRHHVDEILIADTGSTDKTREIALSFGAKVYDYPWKSDFSDARNFIFQKAGCDYVYSADADEVLDEENGKQLEILKQVLDPQIEIVQMYYRNHSQVQSVYNAERELRPKLFKRQRGFIWEDPVHEQVRLTPLVFDSDIVIDHYPEGDHTGRDLQIFLAMLYRQQMISKRLHTMFARELWAAGKEEDYRSALSFFKETADGGMRSQEELREALCVLVRGGRILGDEHLLMKYGLKDMACGGSAEVCCELGDFYLDHSDAAEALMYYDNAAHHTECILDIHAGGDRALMGMAEALERLGNKEQALEYRDQASRWTMPEE